MEIKVTEVKSWIRENKGALSILLVLILSVVAGAVFYITHHKTKPEYMPPFPVAAISADISAARIKDLIQDINLQRSKEEEVITSAKNKAIKAVADLNNDDVAAAWNTRIGEYRESRHNQNIVSGDATN